MVKTGPNFVYVDIEWPLGPFDNLYHAKFGLIHWELYNCTLSSESSSLLAESLGKDSISWSSHHCLFATEKISPATLTFIEENNLSTYVNVMCVSATFSPPLMMILIIQPWIVNALISIFHVSSHDIACSHGLRIPGEEITFTARSKIKSQSQIFSSDRSIFCLPHRPKISDFFDLCLHWVSVVRALL